MTKDWQELYACLDKHKINRKADYCNFVHVEDTRYFGNNIEHAICLSNYSVEFDASSCNLDLKEDQRKLYEKNTDFSI
jgi:hypothetical protein